MTASRRSLLVEATGWSTFVAITVIAGRGPVFEPSLSVAVFITLSITTLGLGVSIAARRSGLWSAASIVAVPLLAVPFAAAVHAPSIRTLAMALAPLSIALVAVWQRTTMRSATSWLATAAALTVLVDLAFRDPYRELNCRPVCPVSPWAVDHRPDLLATTGWALLAVSAWCSATILYRSIVRSSEVGTLSSLLTVGVLMTGAVTRVLRPHRTPDDALVSWVTVIGLLCVGALASVGLWPVVRSSLDRRRVNRWVAEIEGADQGHAVIELLREAAHDPHLAFVGGSEIQPGLVTTAVRRRGHQVAVVEHLPESAERLRSALSPMMVALVENELMVDEATRQLDELRAARRLAIERSDDARRQLQRDLHDGAQQHLLALGMALSALAAESQEPARRQLDAAAQHAAHALERLRAVAHSSTPPVLDDIGLDEALRSLAEACAIDIDLHLPVAENGRQPRDVERAAYRMVSDVVAGATEVGAARLTVRLDTDHGLIVTTAVPANEGAVRIPDADRIEAAGGTFTATVESGFTVCRARFT